MPVVSVSVVYWDNKNDRWEVGGLQTIRTQNVRDVTWCDYSQNCGFDVYQINFFGGARVFTGPRGRDTIARYME